jgi:hypothetical protein
MQKENQANRTQMNQEIRNNKEKMQQTNMQNKQMMGNGATNPTGELSTFFKTPLTQDEKVAFKAIMDAHQVARETIMKDTSLSPADRVSKMKSLMAAHFEAILSYIATDKVDAFNKTTANMIAMMEKNQGLRQENKDNRQEFKDNAKETRQDYKKQVEVQKQALSEKIKGQLTMAIEKLNAEKLEKILSNIEKVVVKIGATNLAQEKKDRILAQVFEIKSIVQEKINSLSGNSLEGNILNEILTGIQPDSQAGTSVITK